MYNWRKMEDEQRQYVLKNRQTQKHPWHSPKHIQSNKKRFHIVAACYEHKPIIGHTPERMANFEDLIFSAIINDVNELHAWSILPNHYHILLTNENLDITLKNLFKIHQKTGFEWNREENSKGRKVWFNALEHGIKSERHFWATVNYIHHNPIKHDYVKKWEDWPFVISQIRPLDCHVKLSN